MSCRNRYLILDVLGQGTFGQVVKCQNLKTQEVVAVKVIKNKTAYFNQSMMEVSVLDLVRTPPFRLWRWTLCKPAQVLMRHCVCVCAAQQQAGQE